MFSAPKIGLVAVGLGLALSVVACGVLGESSESSSSDISFGRPGRGRPPGQPILAEDDAAPPQPSILARGEEDAAPPPPTSDEDAGDLGDAGSQPPVVDPPADPPPADPPPADQDAAPAP